MGALPVGKFKKSICILLIHFALIQAWANWGWYLSMINWKKFSFRLKWIKMAVWFTLNIEMKLIHIDKYSRLPRCSTAFAAGRSGSG